MRLRLFGYTGHDDGQIAVIDVEVATTSADEAGEIVGEVLTRLCIAETDRRERDAAPSDVCHPGAACSKPEPKHTALAPTSLTEALTQHATMLANLTATQARCTAQEQEIRGLRRSYGGVVGRDGMVWSSVGGAEPWRQP